MRRFLVCFLLLYASSISEAADRPARHRPRTLRMEASAFTLDAKPTASGTVPHVGIVAADPRVLPMGTRIRITGTRGYNGVYTVTDTGPHVVGRRIDIYVSSAARAKRFGRRTVTVQVLDYGEGIEDAQAKDVPGKRRR